MLRTRILPRTISDACATIFLIIAVPTIYSYELFFVMPMMYPMWSPWYNFHFLLGTFIFINITSNIVAIVLCDTSIKGRQLLPNTPKDKDWTLCSVCETMAPPRSWHCPTCQICVLKRDHHCTFTSCCIGHYNMRYFLMFVAYIFIATAYATVYNTYFLTEFVDFKNIYTLLKIIFPLAMLVVHVTTEQYYLLMYLLNLLSMIFTGVLLYYHGSLMLEGKIQHERKEKSSKYNLGAMNNVKEVFGERWYLVWIFPTIESKLPSDGINWKTIEPLKNR